MPDFTSHKTLETVGVIVSQTMNYFNGREDFKDQHPLHQALRFKHSVKRLRQKALELQENVPSPTIKSKIDDNLEIEIPLFHYDGKYNHNYS